jgi:YVTN family beta-propeller protein
MIDDPGLAERALRRFDPPNDAFERVLRSHARRARARRLGVVLFALILATLAIGGSIHALRFDRGQGSPADGGQPRIVSTIDGFALSEIGAFGEGGLWTAGDDVRMLDPSTETGSKTVHIGPGQWSKDVAIGDGAIWVAGSRLFRIDPVTAQVKFEVRVPHAAAPYVWGGSVWVSNHGSGTVTRLDARTGDVLATIDIPGRLPFGIVAADGSIWVGVQDAGLIARIDPTTNEVIATITTPATRSLEATSSGVIGFGAGEVGVVVRIDPAFNTVVAEYTWDTPGMGFAADDDGVWVGSSDYGTRPVTASVLELDPVTLQVLNTVPLPERAFAIVIGDGSVWVGLTSEVLVRIDPSG